MKPCPRCGRVCVKELCYVCVRQTAPRQPAGWMFDGPSVTEPANRRERKAMDALIEERKLYFRRASLA